MMNLNLDNRHEASCTRVEWKLLTLLLPPGPLNYFPLFMLIYI
ncbi:unnamed protein product [Amoebophrya sp. A120]|nr:unnamed protein product [Amoebophrya sp. A120]|eukprot:GSA120T00014126001.1